MNRKIKFRAWDKDDNKMLQSPDATPWFILQYGIKYNFHVMQYTGLHDKNGVEIYEGDIIEHHNMHGNNYNSQVKWEVVDNWSGYLLIGSPKDVVEVIGNVHQNKELLS
jgi:hypothetical protein